MGFVRFLRTILSWLVAIGCVGAAAVALLFVLPDGKSSNPAATFTGRVKATARAIIAPKPQDKGPPFDPGCPAAPPPSTAFDTAAADNAASLNTQPVTAFGRPEAGWAIYAPLAAHEIATGCAPETPGFAAALADWQGAHGVAANGRMDAPTLSTLSTLWLLRRPFVRAMKGGCPASPNEQTLAKAGPTEAFGGKTVLARPAALDAYRRMVAAARAEITAPPPLLTIASAYRGPAEEAARCADGTCGNPAKAHCSAHRTGLAFDLYLDALPGQTTFSTADGDRLRLSQTPAYRWLVRNADRFGFVPYPFEPWHWEWTGEPV